VGAIITLALNFLLIPTMSYGSAIATIAAYGSMMSISTIWEQILSHSLRFKENRGYLSLSILFQPYHFMVSERIIMNRFINRVPIFYLSQ
jgi:O-antigen/teichoic acid export membrane protein